MDLFAGSGSLGLEALSRGAASCLFVDMSRESSITIEKNLNKTRLQNGKVKRQKVSAYLRSCESIFDVIFADPPYDFSDDIKNLEELFSLTIFIKY